MLLCDPYAVHAVTNTIVSQLHDTVNREDLPRVRYILYILVCLPA